MSIAAPVRREVASLVDAGLSPDEIDRSVLEHAQITEEERAALWLYAWGKPRRKPGRRRDTGPARVPEVPLG
jgi:hypothetical protein